jgi:cyclopropane-fatty-acyl-phospholipid synthase
MAHVLEPQQTARHGARSVGVVTEIQQQLTRRGLEVALALWDGTALGPDDAGYRLRLNHPWSLRSLLPLTSRAVGESYLRDDVDVDGSMLAAVRVLAGAERIVTGADRRWLLRAVLRLPRPPRRSAVGARLRGRRHSPSRDAWAVRFHYDVGNDFYRQLLDSRLVYSCAYYDAEPPPEAAAVDRALERAQLRKLDLICRKLALSPGERFLDVGCGWGALVLHAAASYGVDAVGITLSPTQAELARQRVAEAGLADRVEIRVADYRELDGTFDAIASVGMFEHVGAEQLGRYFTHLWQLTGPGGRLLNHGITTGQRNTVRDLSRDRGSFVGAHVFPDGALVPASMAVQLMAAAGFEIHDLEQLRPHYALTLRAWLDRLERNADAARRLAGDRVYRTWRAYLAGSVVGFESGDLGVVQILGSRGARLPLTRAHQQPLQPPA